MFNVECSMLNGHIRSSFNIEHSPFNIQHLLLTFVARSPEYPSSTTSYPPRAAHDSHPSRSAPPRFHRLHCRDRCQLAARKTAQGQGGHAARSEERRVGKEGREHEMQEAYKT